MALRRLAPGSEWREKQKQILVPVRGHDTAGELLRLIGELWERDDEN